MTKTFSSFLRGLKNQKHCKMTEDEDLAIVWPPPPPQKHHPLFLANPPPPPSLNRQAVQPPFLGDS